MVCFKQVRHTLGTCLKYPSVVSDTGNNHCFMGHQHQGSSEKIMNATGKHRVQNVHGHFSTLEAPLRFQHT